MSSHLITLTLGILTGSAITYLAIALRHRPNKAKASAHLRLIVGRDDEVTVRTPITAVPIARATLFPAQGMLIDTADLEPCPDSPAELFTKTPETRPESE